MKEIIQCSIGSLIINACLGTPLFGLPIFIVGFIAGFCLMIPLVLPANPEPIHHEKLLSSTEKCFILNNPKRNKKRK